MSTMTGAGRSRGDMVGGYEGGGIVVVAVVGVGVGDRAVALMVASIVGTGVGALFNVDNNYCQGREYNTQDWQESKVSSV